jgi:hypothetical protein
MSSAAFEIFLARLYVEPVLRATFLRDQCGTDPPKDARSTAT